MIQVECIGKKSNKVMSEVFEYEVEVQCFIIIRFQRVTIMPVYKTRGSTALEPLTRIMYWK